MRKSAKYVSIITLSMFAFILFTGCNLSSNSKNSLANNSSIDTFNVQQFENKMKAKNYDFKMKDVQKDFLSAKRTRMTIGKEHIDIYSFRSNKDMEKEAKFIDSDGSGYNNGAKSVKVEWGAPSHFYKKGSIIVQYVGENQKIIADLKYILGKQFAGDTNIICGSISKDNIISFKLHNIKLEEKEINNKSDRGKIIDLINSVKVIKSNTKNIDGIGFGVTITYSNGQKFTAGFLSSSMNCSTNNNKETWYEIDKNIVNDLRNYYDKN